MKKITALYIRTSDASQNTASQKAELKRYVDGHGISNIEWFIDSGKSGESLDRPEFMRMQEKVFNGEISTIIFSRLDRVSRKISEGITIMDDWIDRKIKLVAVNQQMEFSGATGLLLRNILLAVGCWETQTRRERQAAGIAEARKAGKYKGGKVGRRKVSVSKIKTLKYKGRSITEISKLMNVSRQTVYNYLN